MFIYTRSILDNTLDAIKKIARGIEFSVQGIYIVYLIIALTLGTGIFFANAIIFTISVAYLVYDICTTREWYTDEEKTMRQRAKMIANYSKKVIQLIVIVIAVVELCIEAVNGISFLMTSLMIIGFVFSFLMDLIIIAIEKRKKLIIAAVVQDFNIFGGARDIIHKITRHELTKEEIEEAEMKEQLKEICAIQKEKKTRKKAWKKELARKERAKKKELAIK